MKFYFRDTAGSPERARWLHPTLHPARSGSQSQRAIWFILPARGANHIINQIIDERHYFRHFTVADVKICRKKYDRAKVGKGILR